MPKPSDKLTFLLEVVLHQNTGGEKKKYDDLHQPELVEFEVGPGTKAKYICSEGPLEQEAEGTNPNTVIWHFPKMGVYLAVNYSEAGAVPVVMPQWEVLERYQRWEHKAPGAFDSRPRKKAE